MIKSLVNKQLLGFKPYEPGKPIAEVSRELGLRSVIKLASNENPFGPSPRVIKKIQHSACGMAFYPDGSCYYLKQALGRKLRVKPAQIIFGNGSNEIIEIIYSTFIGSNDNIVVSRHAFVVYKLAAMQRGIRFREVAMTNFTHDLQAMARSITRRTKAVFIANPNNPTGTMNTRLDLLAFLKKVPRRVLVVLDEAYSEYVTDAQYPDSLKILRDHPNLIVLRTFSKIYGLAGLRIGYAVADSKVIQYLQLARQPFNVNAMAQEAALEAIQDHKYVKYVQSENEKGRKYLECALTEIGLEYIPSHANFILIRVAADATRVFRNLLTKGVIVRPMTEYGFSDYIRVTIGKNVHNQRFIKALKNVLGINKKAN